jgi:transcription elongation factor GreA
MNNEKSIFTKEGFEKLQTELKNLKTKARKEIAAKLTEAKEYGDLSENAAYQNAMEQRDLNEARIAELEEMLANAKIVKTDENNKDGKVSLGDKVVLESADGMKLDFEIVGAGESDIVGKKFNANSPLVSAILGRKKGDSVEIALPAGKKTYKIVSVN